MVVKLNLQANGPIELDVENGEFPVLQCEGGRDIKIDKAAFLCRCGESKNKPFCDWTHVASGFSDENKGRNDKLQDYEAPGITVHFNRAICSGASQCVHSLPAVFKSASKDWIHPAEATVEEVVAAIGKCPSGALTYTIDGKTEKNEATEVSIRVVKNGPYEIKGPVAIDAPRWSENASQTTFALCRCGKSANIPFCDYSHGEQNWDDSQ